MKAEDVPERIELETDGKVWAVLHTTASIRKALAHQCTATHQSLSTTVERWINRIAKDKDSLTPNMRQHGTITTRYDSEKGFQSFE